MRTKNSTWPALKDISPVWLLPINLYRATNSKVFWESAINFSVVLLYLPLATLFLTLFKNFRKRLGFLYLNIAVVFLLLYWLSISVGVRYFLHLFPVYLGYHRCLF